MNAKTGLGIAAGVLAAVAVVGLVTNVPVLLFAGLGAAVVAGAAAVGLVVAAGAANRKSEESERDRRTMNMPVESFAEKQAEDIAAKYGEARPRPKDPVKEAAARKAEELSAKLDREKGRTPAAAASSAAPATEAEVPSASTVDEELEQTRAAELR